MAIRLVFNPQTGWKGSVKSEPITWREMNILVMIAQGYSNKEIAESFGIKYQTVKNNLYRLTKKLGAKNNANALLIAMNSGLIKLEIISDDMDESLPAGEREKARVRIEKELEKAGKMSEEEAERYMQEQNRKAIQEGQ
jgi:DNA-binding CsgD family transcriptional regulator